MSDPFDPFSLDDDAFETSAVHTSEQSGVNKSTQSNDSTFFDSSFLQGTFSSPLDDTFDDKHSPAKARRNSHDLDSDIYSQLFMSPSQLAGAGTNTIINNASEPSGIANQRIATSTRNTIAKDLKPAVKPHIVQISVVLHEEMSVIYDSEPNSTPVMDVKGAINFNPSASALQGKTFYIALSDPDKHFQQVTSFFEIAKEVTDHLKEEHPFVKRNREQGNRIYRVEIPRNLESLAKPMNLIKYTGSEYLRPIPLLVNVKVRVVGNFCRVGLKIRSNPTNDQKIQNMVILIAVPPDVSGESVKMSRQGGRWDPMKRVIIYKCDTLICGETVDVQLQFDYKSPALENGGGTMRLPRFPMLVRCDGLNDQLSTIGIKVCGALGDTKVHELHVDKSYKVFHRKI